MADYHAEMIAFVRDDFQSEQEARHDRETVMSTLPPPRTWKYDKQFLRFARDYEDATGKVILNPRNIDTVSLEDVDLDWRADLAAYRQMRKFFEDYDKRPFWQK